MNTKDKLNLITRDLQEIIGQHAIESILGERDLNVYWGTAPTGRIHVGYLYPMLKIADLLDANCNVTILLADLHAFLDDMKSSWDVLKFRTEYYKLLITQLLQVIGVSQEKINKIKFVKGTDFQLSKEYTIDVYKANSIVRLHEATKAGAEIVRQNDNPKINSLLYPTLQALDEQYLSVDIFFGGVDQRHCAIHARNVLPLLGYPKRSYLLNPMVPGLSKVQNGSATKMSSSSDTAKIDILDDPKQIKTKINSSYCLLGDITDNTPLLLLKLVLFKILDRSKSQFVIERPEKYGGKIIYNHDQYQQLELDFANKKLHPMDLKKGIIDMLTQLLEPIRNTFNVSENKKLLEAAYP